MTSTAIMQLVLLFTGLVIACPFDAPGGHPHYPTTASPEAGAFCGMLHSSIAGTVPLKEPASLFPSEEPVASVLNGYPLWSLAQSIDHPPELSA